MTSRRSFLLGASSLVAATAMPGPVPVPARFTVRMAVTPWELKVTEEIILRDLEAAMILCLAAPSPAQLMLPPRAARDLGVTG